MWQCQVSLAGWCFHMYSNWLTKTYEYHYQTFQIKCLCRAIWFEFCSWIVLLQSLFSFQKSTPKTHTLVRSVSWSARYAGPDRRGMECLPWWIPSWLIGLEKYVPSDIYRKHDQAFLKGFLSLHLSNALGVERINGANAAKFIADRNLHCVNNTSNAWGHTH